MDWEEGQNRQSYEQMPISHGAPNTMRMQSEPLPKSGLAITGLVLGIIALVSSWMPFINNVSFFIALIGLVFSIVGLVACVRKTKSGKGLAIAALVLCVLSCVLVLATQSLFGAAVDEAGKELDKMTGNATEQVLGKDVQVDIGEFSVDDSGYLAETALPVTVTNISKDQHSFSIQLEAVDSSGNRIDDGYVSVDDLAAGQSQTLKAFSYVSSDKLPQMREATFNVVSVSEY